MTESRVWLGEDGIVRIDHGVDPELSLDLIQRVFEARARLCPQPHPVMVLGRGRPKVSKEAKAFTQQAMVARMTTAIAYVADSYWIRNMVKLYLLFDTPPYPAFVVSSEAEAVAWLKRYVPKTGNEAA
ncbi:MULTISPECIES: STAS/SEC14 domain-containing protein [Leeia]|uniref:STAS/SEC14 domain-containing protein n=1 Tax=Leeia aquatica TaxID=2725557 RepID=A0A847S8A0_9NEIS|nr:STAS/SEC14 domain-containing protein [Leeia aquatica]NLR76184.1 STAS/SEC14 domain-containing protein [Leeia aquatica]